MSIAGIEGVRERSALARVPAWLWFGAGVYLLMLLRGNDLLNDPDMFWQIKVGQWILDQRAVPYADAYSLTKAGAPWMSSSWLSQVLYAKAYTLAGWSGPVILAALAIAATFALLVHLLKRHVRALHASLVAMVVLALAAQHLLARPHVLAMPFMMVWVAGLIAASERRVAPSFGLLPLIALWANLHGSFILGLALIAPIMLDALWNAERSQRRGLGLRWIVFGLGALAAACVTPYGWGSLWAAKSILDLGPLLSMISEWAPPSFAQPGLLECCILLLVAAALWRGVTLSPPRILLVLGLLHMALGHIRNVEVFALLTPIVLAVPLARQFGWNGNETDEAAARASLMPVAVLLVAIMAFAAMASLRYKPNDDAMPVAAVAALRDHGAKRVFNDYAFGGYLIWAGIPPFIDGRAELYGEKFGVDAIDALSLSRPDTLLSLLSVHRIDATLLSPSTPAARLMDHLEGWTRVFADKTATVHVRTVSTRDQSQDRKAVHPE